MVAPVVPRPMPDAGIFKPSSAAQACAAFRLANLGRQETSWAKAPLPRQTLATTDTRPLIIIAFLAGVAMDFPFSR